MERVTLTALVEPGEAGFVARVEGLGVCGAGESPEAAREDLVQAMLAWISGHDCGDTLNSALAAAGFPEIDDDTELELEFAPLAAMAGES